MRYKMSAMLLVMSMSSFVYSGVDPSGTWVVKAVVVMSSCNDMPMMRATSEQWIVNPTNTGYQVQVIGNANQDLKYDATFNNEGLMGRYEGGNSVSVAEFSDFVIGFKSDDKVGGMRVVVRQNRKTPCEAVSLLEFKKLN